MSTVFEVLYAPIAPIVLHPERAFMVAALFAILFVVSLLRTGTFKPRHLVMLFAVLAWVLFGLNEVQAQANGWNIRVDLLVSCPVVLAVSIAAAWTGFRKDRSRVAGDQNAQKSPDEVGRCAEGKTEGSG